MVGIPTRQALVGIPTSRVLGALGIPLGGLAGDANGLGTDV
ncbi:hypothetical protein ACTVZO_43380 [Streptomyces sp. IBSNAI002]